MTIGVALGGPRIGRVRVPSPGLAAAVGVLVLVAADVLASADLLHAGSLLWRAIVTIASIMVLSSAAQRLGVLDWLAGLAERGDVRGPDGAPRVHAIPTTDYRTRASINTDYNIHPEEILADNFGLLVDRRAKHEVNVARPEVLDALEAALAPH